MRSVDWAAGIYYALCYTYVLAETFIVSNVFYPNEAVSIAKWVLPKMKHYTESYVTKG